MHTGDKIHNQHFFWTLGVCDGIYIKLYFFLQDICKICTSPTIFNSHILLCMQPLLRFGSRQSWRGSIYLAHGGLSLHLVDVSEVFISAIVQMFYCCWYATMLCDREKAVLSYWSRIFCRRQSRVLKIIRGKYWCDNHSWKKCKLHLFGDKFGKMISDWILSTREQNNVRNKNLEKVWQKTTWKRSLLEIQKYFPFFIFRQKKIKNDT